MRPFGRRCSSWRVTSPPFWSVARTIQAAREALDLTTHPECQYAWGEADAAQVWGRPCHIKRWMPGELSESVRGTRARAC
jgi:hypothetical protein